MGWMKYLSSGLVMMVALILGGIGYGVLMTLFGMDSTVEIGLTLGAFIFGVVVAGLYGFMQSKFGRKLPR